MKIAIDIDDVLVDTVGYFAQYYNENYGANLTRSDFFSNEWWTVLNIKKEEAIKLYFDYSRSPLHKNTKPMPEAVAGVKDLSKNHTLIAVTGRPEHIMQETEEWIAKFFPGCFQGVYSTNFHVFVGGKKSKGDICAELGAECLIDDFVEHAEECTKKNIPVLLLDTPWTQDISELPAGIIRVYSWEDIKNYINKEFYGKSTAGN